MTNPEFEAKINSAVVVSGVEYELPYYLSVAVNAATIIVAVICLIKYSGKGKISDPIKGRMIPKTFSVTDWVWRSLVARQNGVLEVASSILVTQTKQM